jgi:hypothetical protein
MSSPGLLSEYYVLCASLLVCYPNIMSFVQYVDSQHRLPVTIFEWQHISQVQLTSMVDKPLDQYVFKGLLQFQITFFLGKLLYLRKSV